MINIASAQVSTTTINTAVTDSLATLTTVLTTNVPLVVSFAVGLITLFFVWRLFKRFIKGR